MDKLGYTFYPKDWWTSDTFFKLPPELRYLYLEITSLMYLNDGKWNPNRFELTKRFGVDPGDEGWEVLGELFTKDENHWTHESINKRLKKAITSRENGKTGGRPITQKTQENNLKEPALERERKEKEKEKEKGIEWFRSQIDEIYMEILIRNHPGKNIDSAIQQSFSYLAADTIRLQNADSSDCKKLLNTWLSKMNSNIPKKAANPYKIQ